MWPFNLSVRLPIVALVGRYPANQLMGRRLIPRRSRRSFPNPACAGPYHAVLSHVSMCYPGLEGRLSTCYSPVRRSGVPKDLTARLACLRRAASVRSEPGSNSPSWSPAPKCRQLFIRFCLSSKRTRLLFYSSAFVQFSN